MKTTTEYPEIAHQVVAQKFIERWQKRRSVIGALLVGSYAVNLQTPMSDIDICIILDDSIPRWHRGHAIKSGYLIEYAAYPLRRLRQLQDSDVRDARRLRTRMLATGVILYDPQGIAGLLQEEARSRLKEKLPTPVQERIELEKYFLWDQLDNLRDMAWHDDPGFRYAYYACLQRLIDFYASVLGAEIPRPNRLYRFLVDAEFREHYSIEIFPDEIFARQFEEAMREPDLRHIETLTAHVHKNTGGFIANRWRLSGTIRG